MRKSRTEPTPNNEFPPSTAGTRRWYAAQEKQRADLMAKHSFASLVCATEHADGHVTFELEEDPRLDACAAFNVAMSRSGDATRMRPATAEEASAYLASMAKPPTQCSV